MVKVIISISALNPEWMMGLDRALLIAEPAWWAGDELQCVLMSWLCTAECPPCGAVVAVPGPAERGRPGRQAGTPSSLASSLAHRSKSYTCG